MKKSSAKYLLRFDDICPTMKWTIWDRVEEILLKYNIKPIIAVIPDNVDPMLMCEDAREGYWEKLLQWQSLGWTIALHGYRHNYENKNSGILKINNYSEFAGVNIEEQNYRVKSGLKILKDHGIKVKTWVAPAHSFDNNTLKILAKNGLKIVSDGYSNKIFERKNLIWIPCQLYKFLEKQKGCWTVCKHPSMWNEHDLLDFEKEIEIWHNHITDVDSLMNDYKKNGYLSNFVQWRLSKYRCSKIYFKHKLKRSLRLI